MAHMISILIKSLNDNTTINKTKN
eukprot:UN05200